MSALSSASPTQGIRLDIHLALLQDNLEMLQDYFILPLTYSLIVPHCYIYLCYPEQCYLLFK
jgi:hypothetical protein